MSEKNYVGAVIVCHRVGFYENSFSKLKRIILSFSLDHIRLLLRSVSVHNQGHTHG